MGSEDRTGGGGGVGTMCVTLLGPWCSYNNRLVLQSCCYIAAAA